MRSVAWWSPLASHARLRASTRVLSYGMGRCNSTSLPRESSSVHGAISGPAIKVLDEPIAGPSTTPDTRYNAEIQEVVVAIAANAGSILSSSKGRDKRKKGRFHVMEGIAMNPMDVWRNCQPEGTIRVSDGTLPDKVFEPLQEVQGGRRNRIPKLAHGLDAVLRREGVHWLRDPETGMYNFPQYLETIPRVEDFAFDRLPGFVPSSQDKNVITLAKRAQCRFAGSTSSLTGILTQIYLLLSEEKLINISNLSTDFKDAPRFFTPGQRIPTSVILRYQNGVYTTDIDYERESDEEIILLPMGTLLEKFFTLPKEIFDKFRKSYTGHDYPTLKDTHRYAKHEKFLMRSQLDCRDDHLPGTGVFDLKTRAISEIRHDVHNYHNYLNCRIETLTGRSSSFEKEYYDMIRSAFLEYSFQARIGNMDGVMVAYHNTAQIFGFQYVSLREMDRCLFGREGAGARVFLRCVALMDLLYRAITKCFPRRSVRATFEKRSSAVRVWVEPLENPKPDADPPVVELQLRLNNIMHGRPMRGTYAVSAQYPWTVQYSIERSVQDQGTIRANRQRAYDRQVALEQGLPLVSKGAGSPKEPPREGLSVEPATIPSSASRVEEAAL